VGEGSAVPTDPHHTSTTTQPSTSRPHKKQSRRKQRKGTEIPQSSSPTEEHEPTHSNYPRLNSEDRLQLNELMEICTNLQKKVLDLETLKAAQTHEISSFKQRVKKLEKKKKSRSYGVKKLYKVGSSRRVESSDDTSLGAQEDASKQGRKIFDINQDAKLEVEVEKVVSTAEVEVTTASVLGNTSQK
ncbi:hypothetical protein Tco_0254804, partial [Tanacetum coccineum]